MSAVMLAVFSGIAAFTVVSTALIVVARGSGASQRLLEGVGRSGAKAQDGPVPGADYLPRPDMLPGLSERLEQTRFWRDIQLLVLRAGLLLRPSEVLVLAVTAGLAGIGVGWLVSGNIFTALFAGSVTVGGLYVYLSQMAVRRQAQLTSQLPNALDMLSSGLRAGHALTRSLRIVATQSRPPISDEIEHVLQDINVGVSISDALDLLVARTRSYDLELVVAAIQIQVKLGGNLSELLDNIAHVIRERVKLQGEIDAATAEGKLSAVILVAMPFFMAALISVINPGYLSPLFTETVGKMMLVAASVLMLIGIGVIKNLIEIDF